MKMLIKFVLKFSINLLNISLIIGSIFLAIHTQETYYANQLLLAALLLVIILSVFNL